MHMTNIMDAPSANNWDADANTPAMRLVSAAVATQAIDPLVFLHGARGTERVSWRAPLWQSELHGMGAAAQLFAYGEHRFTDIADQARSLFDGAVLPADAPDAAMPALMGGFAFTD